MNYHLSAYEPGKRYSPKRVMGARAVKGALLPAETNYHLRYNYNVPYSCDIGDLIRLFVNFADSAGLAIDPEFVVLKVKSPSNTVIIPLNAEIIKVVVGSYYCDVNVNEAGTWFYRWECSGAGQCAVERTFQARMSNFSVVVP
jgi:hypothetical protein